MPEPQAPPPIPYTFGGPEGRDLDRITTDLVPLAQAHNLGVLARELYELRVSFDAACGLLVQMSEAQPKGK